MTVLFAGRFSVSDAPEAAQELLKALDLGKPIAVDLSELGEGDATLIQLLLSAHRSAQQRELSLRVSAHGFGFRALLERNGFHHLLAEDWVRSSDEVQYYLFEGVG